MIDTTDAARGSAARDARTSLGVWALVLAAAAALLCARMPSFVAVAERAVAPQAAALDDPALAETAVTVGAVSAVGIHLLLLGVGALLAALLERVLGPAAIGRRLRIGAGGLTFAVVVVGLQLAAGVLGVAAVERSWPVWIAAAAVAIVAPAAFPACRASATSFARTLVVTAGTAVLLCAG